jgi:hypothetical protein
MFYQAAMELLWIFHETASAMAKSGLVPIIADIKEPTISL